jgi:hypothetical protein
MNNEKQSNKTKYKDVTIDDVKACKGYEDISDDLAQKIVDAIKVYTEIIYNCFKEGRFEEQKAKVTSMETTKNQKAA